MIFRRHDIVMAIFLNARGFAYAAFEGHLAPVDWGMSDVRGKDKNVRCLELVERTILRVAPDLLILRSPGDKACFRRLRKLTTEVEGLANRLAIPAQKVSRDQINDAFSFLMPLSRYMIVEAIARNLPAFEQYVPLRRKIWQSEDRRMGLFDAAAMVLTFYQLQADSAAQE
ncbi:MAG: hypothetical protein KGQ47_14380 [Hyphomicrobiales bacterium]|nr:hypothetical protein [Hyphomicrobiales bacterium]